MILGIGNDIVDIRRLAASMDRKTDRFKNRLFTQGEQEYCESKFYPPNAYARYYAIKEAAVKALGTGFTHGVGWRSVEIVRRKRLKPTLVFHDGALARLNAMTPEGWIAGHDMSASDEPPYATAIVILYAVRAGEQVAPPGPTPYRAAD